MVWPCQPEHSVKFIDHHGVLLVQSEALLDLQWGLKSVYISTIQSTQLRLGIFWVIQNLWRFGRSCNNEKCSKLELLPPRIFSDFYSFYRYFSHAKIWFQDLFEIWKFNEVGSTCLSPLLALDPRVSTLPPPGVHPRCKCHAAPFAQLLSPHRLTHFSLAILTTPWGLPSWASPRAACRCRAALLIRR
jgi:hypothetical protein